MMMNSIWHHRSQVTPQSVKPSIISPPRHHSMKRHKLSLAIISQFADIAGMASRNLNEPGFYKQGLLQIPTAALPCFSLPGQHPAWMCHLEISCVFVQTFQIILRKNWKEEVIGEVPWHVLLEFFSCWWNICSRMLKEVQRGMLSV